MHEKKLLVKLKMWNICEQINACDIIVMINRKINLTYNNITTNTYYKL